MYRILEYTLLFIVVAALQVFLFDNLHTGFYLNPFIYPAFILLLPIGIRGTVLLLLAAGTGLVMDVFMGTAGINTMATTLMAFCRPTVMRLFISSDILDDGGIPNIARIGSRKFIFYSTTLVLIHSTAFFFLETLAASGLGYTLLKILISTVSSVIVIYFCQLLFVFRRAKV